MSRIEAPVLGEGPSGSVHLQPSALDVGSMNAAEAHSDMGLATPISEDIPLVVADREPTPRYGILPLPATSISATERLDATDSSESTEELGHGKPLVATSSEEDISGYLMQNLGGLPGATCVVRQAGGPAEPCPDSVPQPTLQPADQPTTETADESGIPVLEQLVAPAVEDLVTSSVEECISALVKDPVTLADEPSSSFPPKGSVASTAEGLATSTADDLTFVSTVPQPIQQAHTSRFRLPPFQHSTLLDTLIQRLRTKRVLVHTWSPADECPGSQGAPPIHHRVEDLNASQIFEYLKSGGKSINAPSRLVKEKVTIHFPLWKQPHLRCTGVTCMRETIDDRCRSTKRLTATTPLSV